MPVNILYIIDSLAYGGTEKQLLQLIKNLDLSRFNPHLCTLKTSESLFDELNIPKICLNFVSFAHPSILKSIILLSIFIKKNQIQIVQTYFQDPFLLGIIAKFFNQIKLIGTFRDLGFWRTTCETRKMRLAYPFFSGFLANSEAVRNHFIQVDNIKPEKIQVIYNGVNLQNFLPKSPNSFQDMPFIVGIVANLNRPVKRVQDFIQAAAIAQQNYRDIRFIIVGEGYLRTKLQQLASSLGLDQTIIFTGSIQNPVELIRNFHIGVLTSETEGLSNAIIEYMATGLPVVATNVGGNLELISDGENGFLVAPADPYKLAEKMIYLANNRSLCLKMGEKNIEKILKKFPISVMVNKYSTYYESLMKL